MQTIFILIETGHPLSQLLRLEETAVKAWMTHNNISQVCCNQPPVKVSNHKNCSDTNNVLLMNYPTHLISSIRVFSILATILRFLFKK